MDLFVFKISHIMPRYLLASTTFSFEKNILLGKKGHIGNKIRVVLMLVLLLPSNLLAVAICK